MTYSIVARCPRTGQFGVGIATYSPCVGVRCPVVGPTGAASLQAVPMPALNGLAARLMAEHRRAESIVIELLASAPDPDWRQISVVDAYGHAHAATGSRNPSWAGHKIGEGYVAAGNVLAGPQVVDAIAGAFEESSAEDLAERLMCAVEAGRDAGGQPEGQNSAALLVYGREPYALVDLRVDLHDTPEAELRRLWDWYRPMVPYYAERAVSAKMPRWWQWRMNNVRGWTARHLLTKKA